MNAQMKLYYTANPGLSALKVTPQQIKAKDLGYPYLKCKAAQARHVVGFALALARRRAHGDATREAFPFDARSRMAHCTEDYRRLVVEKPINKDELFDPDECKRAIYRYLDAFSALNVLWRAGVEPEAHASMPWHSLSPQTSPSPTPR